MDTFGLGALGLVVRPQGPKWPLRWSLPLRRSWSCCKTGMSMRIGIVIGSAGMTWSGAVSLTGAASATSAVSVSDAGTPSGAGTPLAVMRDEASLVCLKTLLRRCGTGGLARRTGDCGAIMAMRFLTASKVFRVDGNSTSSMTWLGESNGTGLDGPPCRTEVNGASSKVSGPGCSSLGRAPLAGSKGVGLGIIDPLLPCFWYCFCVGEWDWCRMNPDGFSAAAGLSLSPSVVLLLPLLAGCCTPMSSVPSLAAPM